MRLSEIRKFLRRTDSVSRPRISIPAIAYSIWVLQAFLIGVIDGLNYDWTIKYFITLLIVETLFIGVAFLLSSVRFKDRGKTLLYFFMYLVSTQVCNVGWIITALLMGDLHKVIESGKIWLAPNLIVPTTAFLIFSVSVFIISVSYGILIYIDDELLPYE